MAAPDPLPRTRATGAFERRVGRALEAVLERPGERVLVACSGGPDSTAALVAVTRSLGVEWVTAAHFDHRLRTTTEAREEADLVRALSDSLGVSLVCGRAPRAPRDRAEAAAREARYRWLASACRDVGARICVTGHTMNDQAETVLLRLIRGTGGGGAAGMAAVAPWPVVVRGSRELRVVRPLLEARRSEVERYISVLKLATVQDPSNEALDFARNRLRHRVIPEFEALNPGSVEQIARFASLQRADDLALTAWAEAELGRWAMPVPGKRRSVAIGIDRRALRSLPVAVASRGLRLAAERIGLQLDGAQVDALLRACARRAQHVAVAGGEGRTGDRLLELHRTR